MQHSLYLRKRTSKLINYINDKPIIISCNYGFIDNVNLSV
ncbi:hypothetical protein EAXG_04913 [Escherichia coli TA054]|nr:hypothetical protein EAXG_04913 [Escherichia coli TA054]